MNWLCAVAHFSKRPDDWSAVHEIFSRNGCAGTVEQDEPPQMSAYFFEDESAGKIVAALGKELLDFGASEVSFDSVPEEDWAETWKQFFKPRQIGSRFLIKPTWEDAEADGRIVIELNPGQAFGTGEHPTTRLCLCFLEEIVKPGDVVADLGCGSGILSIAAAKLGASEVHATEIDSAAVAATFLNAALNGVSINLNAGSDVSHFPPCDVVVSNIVSAAIIKLAPELPRLVKAGGTWIISGVIPDNWQDVREAIEKVGLELAELREEDGWLAASLIRR